MHCDEHKRKDIKIISVILCACLLFLSGCGSTEAEKDGGNAEGSARAGGTGRYVEDISAFPEEINRNGGLNVLDDGSMTIISYNSGLYRSVDQGKSWRQEETAFFPMMQGVYALSAVMAPDGTAAVSCSGELPQAAREMLSSPLPDDWSGNYCIFAFPDGNIKAVDFGFSQEDGSCISSFVFKEDGRLFAGDMRGRIYEVDMEHESLKELFVMNREAGYIGFCGDILMAVGADKLYLYDLEKQEMPVQDTAADAFLKSALADGTVRYTGGGYPLAVFGGDEGIIYIACVDGLYRHALGGSTMERIIDGALTTFGDGTSIYSARALEGEEFLVQFGPSGGLVRYHFDESLPSMPDQEIRIYSLEENSTVRKAVTAYKKNHTDMYVRYEVGMKGEDGITAEDAIKRLNTQMLSGEGPDVIMLDGMPMDSYMEKGTLADLGGIMADLEAEDALFSNLAEGFRQEDGKICAVPLCVRVPVLAGEADVLERMEDLESFADEMEALRAEYPEGGILGIYDGESILKLFGMVSASAWIDGTGGIDREAVKEFLTQTDRIYKAELSGALPEEVERMEEIDEELLQYGADPVKNKMEACQNVLDIRCGYARLACGYLDGIQLCLDNITTVTDLENNMCYQKFQGQMQDVYLPRAVVGINAESTQKEAAEEFVKSMFSLEVQRDIGEGFPVNRAAFAENFDLLEAGEENGSMTMLKSDGTEEEMVLRWPDEAQERAFTELVQGLRTPAAGNEWLNELVYETGVKVLEDEVSVDEAVEEIAKKATIYLAE